MGLVRSKRCILYTRTVLYLILFIFSVALLAVGHTLQREHPTDIRVHSALKNDTCVLSHAEVVQCGDGKYVAVWKRVSGGADMAVVSPFAVRSTKEEARQDLKLFGVPTDYGPNVTTRFACQCTRVTRINHIYPNVPCTLQNTCMLQYAETHYVQTVGWVYGYAGDTLLAIGSLILVLTLMGTLLLMMDAGFCCKTGEIEIGYRQSHKEMPDDAL